MVQREPNMAQGRILHKSIIKKVKAMTDNKTLRVKIQKNI